MLQLQVITHVSEADLAQCVLRGSAGKSHGAEGGLPIRERRDGHFGAGDRVNESSVSARPSLLSRVYNLFSPSSWFTKARWRQPPRVRSQYSPPQSDKSFHYRAGCSEVRLHWPRPTL